MAKIEPIVITFAGGINSRKRPHDISIDECVSGENFELDPQQRALTKRGAFDYVATTPNAAEIRGYAQLLKRDGTFTTLIQSGTNVYSWDGETTFALVGTVAATTKMRGPREHNFLLDDICIITDLNKATVVKQWDGTTFSTFTHNLGTDLYAKFARVMNERLFLANVTSGTATPHVLLGSAIGDDNTLTTANRPSSSLGFDAAFYLPMPDLRPINGMEEAFGQFILSTTKGRLFALRGTSAFDFEMAAFYQGSAVSGDEAMVNIGNDLLLGLEHHIETLSGVVNFGDVETNDASAPIDTNIEDVVDWRLIYDRHGQRVFCFPDSQAVCWVLYKALLFFGTQRQVAQAQFQGALSPWSKWTTNHAMAMQPSTVMVLRHVDSHEHDVVFCGDEGGNIYKFDGDGDQDGGTADVTVKRRSGLIQVPNAEIFNVIVNVDYRRTFSTTLTLRFIFAGIEAADATISFPIAADSTLATYGGSAYYGGRFYYSESFSGRIRRQQKHIEGRGNGLQVEIEATSGAEIDIQQIEIILQAAQS